MSLVEKGLWFIALAKVIADFTLLIAVFCWRRTPVALRPFSILIILFPFFDLTVDLSYFSFTSYSHFIRVLTLTEVCLISYFYHLFYKEFFRTRLFIIAPIVCLLVILAELFIRGENTRPEFASAFECLLMMAYALYFYYFVLSRLVFPDLLDSPFFWVNTATLVYYSMSLFVFSFIGYLNVMIEHRQVFYPFIHSSAYIAFDILFMIAYWKMRRK